MTPLTPGQPLVEVVRSGFVESVHCGHLIALDANGNPLLSKGDPDQPVFGRSALKPLQTTAMLELGAPLDIAEIALSASSHSGSPHHLALIEAELTSAGLSENDLACPRDYPFGEPERLAYIAAGGQPRRLGFDCSGKHAAMLRTCLANDWPIAGYLAIDHPLQQHIAATVARLAQERVAATGIDGCGAPVFALTLTGLARSYRTIATSDAAAETAVARAMRTHPELVAGDGRFSTRLARAFPGLVVKEGAQGVYAGALPDGGAFALKISDGTTLASEQASLIGLRALGVDPWTIEQFEGHPVFGGGVPVGTVRPVRTP